MKERGEKGREKERVREEGGEGRERERGGREKERVKERGEKGGRRRE